MYFKDRIFPKPLVFCSRCITFESVRWNGMSASSPQVESLKPYFNFITNCPEYEIGLGVPRQTIRIVNVSGEKRLLQHQTGADVTEKMLEFIESHLEDYDECDAFILKSKSPTSSIRNIPIYYSLEGAGKLGKTMGFFGGALYNRYKNHPFVEEDMLKNPLIFEYFLTKTYMWASFRLVKQLEKQSAIIEFQNHNKFLLMALNPQIQKDLGQIVANHERLNIRYLLAKYELTFSQIMKENFTYKKNINVLEHALGFFKEKITKEEKRFFLDELKAFRIGTIPLSVLIHIMRDWIIRHDVSYLGNQTYFQPYPDEIIPKAQFYSKKEEKERKLLIQK